MLCTVVLCVYVHLTGWSFVGRRGYQAYKYMPYGPVEEVLAYLSRRANENRGLLRGAQRERSLVQTELLHRLTFNLLRSR